MTPVFELLIVWRIFKVHFVNWLTGFDHWKYLIERYVFALAIGQEFGYFWDWWNPLWKVWWICSMVLEIKTSVTEKLLEKNNLRFCKNIRVKTILFLIDVLCHYFDQKAYVKKNCRLLALRFLSTCPVQLIFVCLNYSPNAFIEWLFFQ